MKRSLTLRTVALLALALAIIAGPAGAQTADQWWTNTTSTTFNDANAWSNAVPGGSDRAWFDAGGATYAVTFTGATTNHSVIITNTGQNITFDLGGFSYRITNTIPAGNGYASDWLRLHSGNTLTLSNGTLQGTGVNVDIETYTGSMLIITNGGRLLTSGASGGGGILVSGPGSYLYSYDKFGNSGAITANNGAVIGSMRGGTIASLYIDNAIVTNTAGMAGSGGSVVITNGGRLSQYFGVGVIYNGTMSLGYDTAALATMTIGGGSDLTQTNRAEFDSFIVGRHDSYRNAHMIINSNGLLRILHSGLGTNTIARYGNGANYGYTKFWITDGSDVTLVGGRVEMNQGSKMDIANFPSIADTTALPGLLRGTGTLTVNSGGTTNWSLTNDGWIKPGDTAAGAALGTLNIIKGNLIQTGVLASMFFDFSETGLDQISIVNGAASITGGSNVFGLAAGAAPLGPYKYGLGTYDFIVGTNLLYAPVYDNLSTLLAAAGLTPGLHYSLGVVDLNNGSYALRLQFIPEPSTVLLLVGGGLLLFRLRRKRAGVLLLAALCLLGASTSYAVDQAWTTGDGLFTNTANWSGSAKPIAGDTATFGTGGTYAVTFTGAEFSDYLQVTNTDNVTFLLGGFTYRVDNGGTEVSVGSNATDNVKLVVNGGTLDAEGGSGTSWVGRNGSIASLVVSNGGVFRYNNLNVGANGTLLVTDPGSQLYGGGGSVDWGGLTVTLSNGATAYVANPGWGGSMKMIITGPSTVWSNYVGGRTIGGGGSRFELNDGARFEQSGQWEFGVSGGTQTALVGNATANVATANVGHIMFGTTFDANRGAPELIINAGGIVRAGSSPTVVNTTNVAAWIYDKATLTLNGGIMEVRTNSAVYVANLNAASFGQGQLRGVGTLAALAGTDTFTVFNSGNIRPGDTNATARIGTLNLVQGDLVQGNADGALRIDFDPATPGSADLLNVIDGTITITAGSNIFNNVTGAGTLAFGTWDFLRADSITYTPTFDNLTNIVNGLTNTLSPLLFAGYTYGVINVDGYDVLRLSINMIPEPSTILLLVGGGLVLWRFRRRK